MHHHLPAVYPSHKNTAVSLPKSLPPHAKLDLSASLMENRFKLRISHMFRASFSSCRSRNLADVVEKAVFVPQIHQNFHTIEPSNLSPKHRPFRSICRPKPSQTPEIIHNSCIIPAKELLTRRKVSERFLPFASASPAGRTCPPASPISPLNPFFQFRDFKSKQNKKGTDRSKKKKKKKTTQMKNKHAEALPFSSFSQEDMSFGGWWYSSEDDEDEREDGTDTLFSSKSLSSDSSESQRRRSRRKRHGARRTARSSAGLDLMPMHGKVKDSFAVVKRSSDPCNDFRMSMVEMIVEKQMFAAKDLEQLLQCFLSLNSYHHHKIIIEVFTEICEALFYNWS